jgi:integrase
MQVVFSNALFYVIDYPAHGALELFDRRSGKVGLMMGDVAHQFRHEFDDLLATEPELDAFEDFIDHYSAMMTQSVVAH